MNGARFVHDELVAHGWEVLVADAQRQLRPVGTEVPRRHRRRHLPHKRKAEESAPPFKVCRS